MSTEEQNNTEYSAPNRLGWICPKCDKVLSPDVTECNCCTVVSQPVYVPIYPYYPSYPRNPWYEPYVTYTSNSVPVNDNIEE